MPTDGLASRRHFLSMSAAAAAALAGVGTRRGSSTSTLPAGSEPDWQLVADPDGLFLPAPPQYELRPDAPPNYVEIASVADTSYGLLAVGRELRDFTTYNAMWRSDDGAVWERLPDNDDFGTTEFTGATASTLVALTERDGRVVGSGDVALWWTDDLGHWESVAPPRLADGHPDISVRSVCAGPAGFVAAGVGMWFSPDGVEWEGLDSLARAFVAYSGAAFVDGSFVVAASLTGGPHVVTSPDGRTWTQHALPGGDDDWPLAVCGHDGTLVVTGAAMPDDAPAQTLAWTSSDAGATWTRTALSGDPGLHEAPSVLVHVGGEFVAVVARVGDEGVMNVQHRSADGLAWTEHPVDLPGYRSAATAFRDGAVAVGSQGWMIGMDGPPASIPSPEEIAADPRNASSIWTLGL